ncbi:hypothetical protein H7A76_03220 [Pseudomonas sp. MSSRFD41]|uniref:hypothetical protein n=1 Tax=unclassified Pseudomonas TaxID=196821 RepID=UPI001639967A|nr:hypothetical protein [Pseudomonas sp. MSSRFD41]MBC2654445.1 hypothetical protein [Pseudomonas sp. MSSRFD41]
MSRSLGLREDQRQREHLALRIAGLFPADAWWLLRQSAGSGKPLGPGAARRPEPDRLTD